MLNSRYYCHRAWEMLLVLLVVYSAWICPFEFAFLTYKQDALFIVDHIVNGFFAVDIILTFFVAYVDRRTYLLIDDHKKIAIRSVTQSLSPTSSSSLVAFTSYGW
uniref:Ion transport domain-containing protein n=1 Tax=Opuntia streptacantha TaxID=393608 RepID=A0A7C9D0L2_OPUST